MNVKEASRRYHMAFIPAMVLFLGGSLGLVWLDSNTGLPGEILVALTAVPIMALLSMFWIHWRYMQDIDEFLREIQIRGVMAGAAVALAVGTAWGYLEMYVDAPPISVFWINPLFWVAYAVATVIFTRRAGGGPI